MALPSVDIIIVNWNAGDQLYDCLAAVASSDCQEYKLDKIIVVDNASRDRSLEGLEELNLPLEIIRNTDNQGFGAACNQGASIGRSDYILFLNPDTKVSADSIDKAVNCIKDAAHQQVGVVSIQLVNSQGEIQRNCARFPTPLNIWCSILGIDKLVVNKSTSYIMNDWNHQNSQPVDHVIGAFYLIRREIFQALDGFDETFFVYFEDLDLSYRVHKLGWSSYYLADAVSFHKGGGTSESIKATRIFYSLRSRMLYGYKHFNPLQANAIAIASLSIEFASRMIFSLLRLSPSQAQETLSAYTKLFANIPEIYRAIQKQSIAK
jgi:N-acetylglucosaminyl-diphospho-decaprenol L-rhamnosyltransferase